MNEKDKQIVKGSVDAVISNIPGINIAWGMSKALYGAGLELRKQRALEWVEMVRDNTDIFTEQIFKQEEFQDGFVFSLEKYIRERNSKKRDVVKKIFLGYATVTDKEKFELERMTNILSTISISAIELLAILKPLSLKKNSGMLSELLLQYLVADANDNRDKYAEYKHVRDMWTDAETDLISVGLLRSYNIARMGGKDYVSYYDYDLSKIGTEFIKYIEN